MRQDSALCRRTFRCIIAAMNLHRMLLQRAVAGKPLRVALIGAGKFGSMYLAQAKHTPGIHIVAIADLAGGRIADYGLIATAGVLAALPPVLVGLVMQRALVSGLTHGGVKG